MVLTLCEKCPNTEFFVVRILYLRWIRKLGKYGPEKNFVFGHFLRSVNSNNYSFMLFGIKDELQTDLVSSNVTNKNSK